MSNLKNIVINFSDNVMGISDHVTSASDGGKCEDWLCSGM
jgi:hypothetical protein